MQADSAVRLGGNRWLALGVLASSLFLVGMDLTVLNVAVPTLSRELTPGRVELLWILDAYALAVGVFVLSAGTLGDRIGRKRMLLSGYLVFGLASAAAAFAPGPGWLIVARAALGLGAAMIMATTVAIIRVVFTDDRERTLAIALWSTSHAVGAAAGPILGGLLVQHWWWGSVFLVNVPVVLVGLLIGVGSIPESKDPRPRRWDLPSVGLSMVGVGCVVYAFKEIGGYGPDLPSVLAGLVGITAIVVFIRLQRRLRDPLLHLSIFANRRFSVSMTCAAVAFGVTPALMFLLTQKFQLINDWSPLRAGLCLVPWTATSGLGGVLAPACAARWGHRGGITLGLSLFTAAIVAMALLTRDQGYLLLGLALALAGLGMGIAMPLASDGMMTAAEPERAGEAGALQSSSFELGGGLGIVVLGTILSIGYRLALPPVPGVAPPAMSAAGESLGGATAVAAELPEPAGAALLAAAQGAFSTGFATAAWVAAALVAMVTILAAVRLRPTALTPPGP